MIPHTGNNTSQLSEPRAHRCTGGHYYLSSIPTNPEKVPNLLPPANAPIYTEFRILKHVVASTAGVEVGALFHNGKKAVSFHITLQELGFTQPPTPIKKDNFTDEGIVTATVRKKRFKAMDM